MFKDFFFILTRNVGSDSNFEPKQSGILEIVLVDSRLYCPSCSILAISAILEMLAILEPFELL